MIPMRIGVPFAWMAANWCAVTSVPKFSIRIVIFLLFPHCRTRVKVGNVYSVSISRSWPAIRKICKRMPVNWAVWNCRYCSVYAWSCFANMNKVYISVSQSHHQIRHTMKLYASEYIMKCCETNVLLIMLLCLCLQSNVTGCHTHTSGSLKSQSL